MYAGLQDCTQSFESCQTPFVCGTFKPCRYLYHRAGGPGRTGQVQGARV